MLSVLGISCDWKIAPQDTARSSARIISESQDYREYLPEGFLDSYTAFHTDSLYQMQHIDFPLSGRPIEYVDGEPVLTNGWAESEWQIHRAIHRDEPYDLDYRLLDEHTLEEYIIHRITGMGLLRRWEQRDSSWHLIYYTGMRPASELH